MTRPKPRYQPGDRIGGRYQVHKALLGGMGEVYLCLDLEEMYPYALKTFQQRYQSSTMRRAFEQEVTTWVALEKHPNIVRCHAMVILDNKPFMILEWIAGEEGKGADLRGWLRHGPLELKTALEITIDVVRGLIHAQAKQRGLIHRDLKPENILVAQGGLAKITDFGLAQIVARAGLEFTPDTANEPALATPDNRAATVSIVNRQSKIPNPIAGTPVYMAPEQWREEALDARTDIYAVGCILYELLTGTWPYQAEFRPTTPRQYQQWLSVLQQGHEKAPPPPLPRGLPNAVGEIVQGCLAKTADDRPTGLAALLAQLSEVYERQFDQPPRPPAGTFTAGDYNNRGVTYTHIKQYETALADFGRAIDLDSALVEAYNNRGLMYKEMQQYEVALADYNRAIDLNPAADKAYNNRGLMYQELQQYEAALADYSQAIQLDPNYANAHVNIAVALREMGRLRDTLSYLEKAAQLGDPTGIQYLAQARQMLGETAPEPQPDPTQAAFEAFRQAASPAAMRQAVAQYPFMAQPDFIAAVEQAIAQQAPPEQRPYFEQRLGWLKQIAQEQNP